MKSLRYPADSPEQAMRIAQGNCINEKGSYCHAHGGVCCPTCSKYKEGMARREECWKDFQARLIDETKLRDIGLPGKDPFGKEIMILRKEDHGYTLAVAEVKRVMTHSEERKEVEEKIPVVIYRRRFPMTSSEALLSKELLTNILS